MMHVMDHRRCTLGRKDWTAPLHGILPLADQQGQARWRRPSAGLLDAEAAWRDLARRGPSARPCLVLGYVTHASLSSLLQHVRPLQCGIVDHDPQALANLRLHLHLEPQPMTVTLHSWQGQGIALPAGSQAAVVSLGYFHQQPDVAGFLSEALRVLVPGGVLYLRDFMRPAEDAQLAHLLADASLSHDAERRAEWEEVLHQAYTLEEVRSWAEAFGFYGDVVQATSDHHWTWSMKKP